MSGRLRGQRPGAQTILRGVLLLARGRAEGLRQFGDTPQAFLASLAPLIAFPLVGYLLLAAGGHGTAAIAGLLGTLCALLAPPVISFELARWWGRQHLWLRYATAVNWCQWAIPLLASALLLVVYPVLAQLLSDNAAGVAVIAAIAAYALWLHWFLARHALALSGARAALLVGLVNLGTALLVLGPRLLSLGAGHAG